MKEPSATVNIWSDEPLDDDVADSIERISTAHDVRHLAVMPDVHLAVDVCVGMVLATTNSIYPAAVGGDIGCGMAAVQFAANADLLTDERSAARVLAGLYEQVPTNRHSAATAVAAIPDALQTQRLSHPRLDKLKSRDGRVQFGTLGRGNHFLEFQADQDDQLWIMVHSGSRAMGQAITHHHLTKATNESQGMKFFDAHSEAGAAYLHDAAWAVRYAESNRLAMVQAVADLLENGFGISTAWNTLIHSNHNHVRREVHYGETLWVHRKGAQSAGQDESGIIPGSMGTASFHVAGRGCEPALQSSSHGAGRKMSRGAARKRVTSRQFHRQMKAVWFDQRRADALRDEAPAAYKDIYAVMRAQRELTRITCELRPLLSYKGR